MARPKIDEIEKLKRVVIELEPEAFDDLADWIERIMEVREADKRAAEARAKRKAATSGE